MTPPISADAEREQQLNQIILTLVQTLEQGKGMDRVQFLAAHPEFAAELDEFFAGRDRLEHLAAPFREAAREGHSPAGASDIRADFGESDVRALLLKNAYHLTPDQGQTQRGRHSPDPALALGPLGDFRLVREVGR